MNSDKLNKCIICGELTDISVEPARGHIIYACHNCLEEAKEYFIFVCMNCGRVHKRLKELVIKRAKTEELKDAYIACRDLQIIQGIQICYLCDPEGILKYHSGTAH